MGRIARRLRSASDRLLTPLLTYRLTVVQYQPFRPPLRTSTHVPADQSPVPAFPPASPHRARPKAIGDSGWSLPCQALWSWGRFLSCDGVFLCVCVCIHVCVCVFACFSASADHLFLVTEYMSRGDLYNVRRRVDRWHPATGGLDGYVCVWCKSAHVHISYT